MTAYPNWFEMTARPYFERHLLPLAGKPDLLFLQIGAFTGDASVWLLDNVLTGPRSILQDVDTWEGSDESAHDQFSWPEVERYYQIRMGEYLSAPSGKGWHSRLHAHKGRSDSFFDDFEVGPIYDFVYIDGDHTAAAVLGDAVRCFDHLKPGGLMAFDDYLWTAQSRRREDAPHMAIDAFVACYRDRLEVIETGGDQVWVRRTA